MGMSASSDKRAKSATGTKSFFVNPFSEGNANVVVRVFELNGGNADYA